MSVTIKDVAAAAGVSICTVSRVLNNTYRNKVSNTTRKRVLAAAASLKYHPNNHARGLRKQQTKLIGVIIPSLGTSFTAEAVQGIQDVCETLDLSTVVYTTQNRPEKTNNFIRVLWEKRVDGLIILEPREQHGALLTGMMEDGIDVVQLLHPCPGAGAPSVTVDQERGAAMAMDHLLTLGHRQILHLSAASSDQHGMIRYGNYVQAMQEAGLEKNIEATDVGYDWRLARRTVKERLSARAADERPTAIFASSDLTALGAMKALYELGISVPEHVSVVGFDDIEVAELSTPGLTTVAQPKYRLGWEAMALLLDQMNDQQVTNLILEPDLLVRQSTGSPAGVLNTAASSWPSPTGKQA